MSVEWQTQRAMALRIDGSKTHHPRSGESPTELRQIDQEFKDVVSLIRGL